MDVEPEEALALLPKGRVFQGRYEIVRCLKAGGMGAVYEVIHLETRRRRALKIMLPSVVASPEMHARFRLEATVAADVESEHIVEVFDAGVDAESGAPFLVMELLRGDDLLAVLGKRKRLPPAEVIPILTQAAGALDKTHAAGVVHRDLKPDNLFLARRDDGSPKLKILDFGIAKVVAESGQPAAKTRILGTPLYMSPEQIRGDGDIGPRADLYALGHIAFALLVGDAYWGAQSRKAELYALMMKIVAGAPDPATTMATRYGAELPAGIDAWFARATALEPADRFSTAAELVESLAEVFGIPSSRRSVAPAEPTSIPRTASRSAQDPAATRTLPDRAQSLTPTTLAPPAKPPPTGGASAEEPPASEAPRERAPSPRRPIVAVAALAAILVVAVVIGTRFIGSGPVADPSLSPAPSPLSVATTAAAPASETSAATSAAALVTPRDLGSAQPSARPVAPPSLPTAPPRKPPAPGPSSPAPAASPPPAPKRTLD